MKKIYIRYKILVNGFYVLNSYSIDGFTLKSSSFDKEIFLNEYDENKNGAKFNLNCYLESCLTDSQKLTYNYFESDNYEEYEISNKLNINSQTVIKLLQTKKEIYNRIDDLERKLRLIFNVPLLFQIISIEVYDENKRFLTAVQGNRQLFFWNRLSYNINPDEFANNSRFEFDFNAMKNTNNNHFNRALEFYNDSFESEKITTRFILIFSALEAIFNLDTENVTEKIARYSAKLLAEENKKEYDIIYTDIKKLYKKRCDYIHGTKTNNIVDADEKLLRFYVRKIIIAYWFVCIYTNKTAKQILEYLNNDEKLDLNVRICISTINAQDFSTQQRKAIDIIEKELGKEIPNETKQAILAEISKKKK